MANLVKLTIDGKTVEAPAGMLVIEAAKRAGIGIPAFCYYEGLTLQAACRMCLVEVEKMPKLQTACTLPVAEGMVVRTETPQIAAARKGMLEFLLANHPLDCPVCDKGGECELQDMAFRYGAGESRFVERKLHVDERQWSPVVYFDRPRCILCFRCVRVCNEGMGVAALGIVNRGAVSEIAPNEGDHLRCDECGMCIDICPVGALTSGMYRYKTRPWEMNHVGTICTHCSNGCKTTLGVRNNCVERGNNRDRSGINNDFLCIKGRYAPDFVDHPDRLTAPLMRVNGKLEEVSWSKALLAVVARFKEVKERGGRFGVIGSNHTTNEENAFLQKMARVGLGTENIDHHRTGDLLTLMQVRPEGMASAADVYERKAVLVVGSDLSQQQPFLAYQVRANVRHHGAHIYVVTRGPVREDKVAARSVRVEPGRELDGVECLRDQLKAETELVVLYGDAVKGDGVRRLVEFGDSLGIPVKYVALLDYSNSRGAVEMGVLPGPGGLGLEEMLAAGLDVLWVVGANPYKKRGEQSSAPHFMVVQDLFLTETAERADIVLPAASAYEKNGTVTSVGGERQRIRLALEKVGTKPDLEIFKLIARGMGIDMSAPMELPQFDARPELVWSANDTLFSSGTLGRYSGTLHRVIEAPGELYS